MWDSQALETAIGLTLLLFLLATATSAFVELLSNCFKWRHKDLEKKIAELLQGGTNSNQTPNTNTSDSLTEFKNTSAYLAVSTEFSKVGASYLSAKSFADAAVELSRTTDEVPTALATRINNLTTDAGQNMLALKAGLEHWFDEAMSSLESNYRKKISQIILVIGFVIASLTNASTIHVAADLWNDTAVRQAVVASAESAYSSGADATAITEVAKTTKTLQELRFPVGWGGEEQKTRTWTWWLLHAVGWFVTALLTMLGGPFWFDLLGKLVSLRSTGRAPKTAKDTPDSNTSKVSGGVFIETAQEKARYAKEGRGGLSSEAALLVGRRVS